MQHILILGAGLSSSYLIKYLLEHAPQLNWHITLADSNIETAKQKLGNHTHAIAVQLDATNETAMEGLIQNADIVVSLLPPTLHVLAAKKCIIYRKNLVTASYISDAMQALHNDALNAGVLLLNECGLDPGIDHLSAMKLINEIHQSGGEITSFKSFCGGLIAPEFDDNPWNYKFTWNPRNVILAGQATAKYLEMGMLKYITPQHIFEQTESVYLKQQGDFESYANRDSLGYIEPYGITKAHTVLRGTLRKKGYSEAWNLLVKLGLTDDTFVIQNTYKLSYREFLNAFVPGTDIYKLEQRVCLFLGIDQNDSAFQKLAWLGLFSNSTIDIKEGSPAQILQYLLQIKWKLNKGELDMIVMKHQIQYQRGNQHFEIASELVVKGEDEILTAMAKTVGLPMAIATKLILTNKIASRGVTMPLKPEFYEPILTELAMYGVAFDEYEVNA